MDGLGSALLSMLVMVVFVVFSFLCCCSPFWVLSALAVPLDLDFGQVASVVGTLSCWVLFVVFSGGLDDVDGPGSQRPAVLGQVVGCLMRLDEVAGC